VNLSIEMLAALLSAVCAGALLGAAGVKVWTRREKNSPELPGDGAAQERAETTKQEAQRFFLLNETGNVLISTSLSPSGRLPEATLELFSEALAHLAAVFFAVAGTNDPSTGKPFSLYNYWALKRAMERHPAFIRVSSENTEKPALVQVSGSPTFSLPLSFSETKDKAPEAERLDSKRWLEERVKQSQDVLGMDNNPAHVVKLRAIHSQLRAEAERLGASRSLQRAKFAAEGVEALQLQALGEGEDNAVDRARSDLDKMEVGHIMLYCECLMGVSIVTVKLAHARIDDYLRSDSMEQDAYLFVSSSQLKQTMSDVSNLPQMNIS